MDRELLDRLLTSPRLPSLPTVALEILELVGQEDVDIKAIAKAISHDAALSGKLLKTVNSSLFGQRRQIGTISDAIVVLGLKGVKTLALGFALIGKLNESAGDGFDHIEFWKRSVYTAIAARTMAKQFGLVQQEEAFLGGLLQDLGILVLFQVLGDDYQQLIDQADGDHRKLQNLEQQNLDLEHAQVGAALAESWKLPRLLAEPIRFHVQPDNGPEDLKPLIRCVALGGDVADLFINPSCPGVLRSYQERTEQWFTMSRDQAEHLLANIHHETVAVGGLFDLPTGQLEAPEVILARANEAMMEISLKEQQASKQLQKQNQHLAEQLVTDSLTGVANRRGLDENVKAQFDRAKAEGTILSLLFLDIDDFKGVNDHHGHHVGDCALISLTNTIRQLMGQTAAVARFGGDEFAVVLAGVDRASAVRMAETIRQQIAATEIKSEENGPVRMTVSIGVATHQDGCFSGDKQLFLAADHALYEAKGGGRNCVRVFTPPEVWPKAQGAA